MISAVNISFKRKDRIILSELSCSFYVPEFVAIIGPNGAGKSTLLQLLSGLHKPSTGSVFIHREEAFLQSPGKLAHYRAYLHQQQSVFESFTVSDVLMMGRSNHFSSVPKPEDVALVNGMLKELNLEDKGRQSFNQLSGGEQQRVQFGRTLLQLQETGTDSLKGKILFLDEPLNNLDLQYQYSLLNLVRDKVIAKGGLVIAVLHDLNVTYQYADRVLVLNKGRLCMDAETEIAMSADLLSSVYRVPVLKLEQPNHIPYFTIAPSMESREQNNTELVAIHQ